MNYAYTVYVGNGGKEMGGGVYKKECWAVSQTHDESSFMLGSSISSANEN